MSQSEIERLIKAVQEDKNLRPQLLAGTALKDITLEHIVSNAKTLGYGVTVAELKDGIATVMQSGDMELSDEELELVAGGAMPTC